MFYGAAQMLVGGSRAGALGQRSRQLTLINYETLCYLIKLTGAVKYGRNTSLACPVSISISDMLLDWEFLHAVAMECACAY